MKFVLAFAALGASGWLGFGVLTDSLPGATDYTRKIFDMVAVATEQFGTLQTGLAIIAAGALLSMYLVTRGQKPTRRTRRSMS